MQNKEAQNLIKVIQNSVTLNNHKVIDGVKSALIEIKNKSSEEVNTLDNKIQSQLDILTNYFKKELEDLQVSSENTDEVVMSKIAEVENSIDAILKKIKSEIAKIQINPVEIREIHKTEQIREVVEIDYAKILEDVIKQLPEQKVLSPEDVRDQLSQLKGDDRLDAKYIKNIPFQFVGNGGSASGGSSAPDKNSIGLGNVDNTSDLSKPISTATQAALDTKQGEITLTTTGSSGAATFDGSILNIPEYAGGSTVSEVEINVGTTPRSSGRFTISGSGLITGKAVIISQANGPYTGKGTLADEAEMDGLIVSGKVIDSSSIECFWRSGTKIKSNFKFNYQVSA